MTHHGAGLRRLIRNAKLVEQIKQDYCQAAISTQDKKMLDYAVKLTKKPWEMTAIDVEDLRFAGFSDAAILDINQIAAYFNFVNRLADGLGVALEPHWDAEKDQAAQ